MPARKAIKRFWTGLIAAGVFIAVVFSIGKATYVPAVLMYHSVTAEANPQNTLSVSLGTFERQMRFLRDHRYHVVPVESLAALIRDKKKIPPRTVAVTFDDGNKDNFTLAFPVLKKYGIPASIYLIVHEIGRADRCSWDQIRQMQESGLVVFGSHTLDHAYLVEVASDAELSRQLSASKKALEEQLKVAVNGLCYPVGGVNERVRKAAIDSGYTYALAISPGKKAATDDVYLIRRVKITEKAANMFIFWAEISGHYVTIKEFFSSKKKVYGY